MRTIKIVAILLCLLVCQQGDVLADTVIHTERSLYRDIIVSEGFGKRCLRFLRNNNTVQACISLNDPSILAFDCTKMMLGALYLQPDPRRVLVIGLGGGTLPTAVSRILPEAEIDIVEIDPAIVRVAKRFFSFKPTARMRVIEEDGRVFVKRAVKKRSKYDLIMLDAFDHEYIPEHLRTREFLTEVKQLLSEDGVVAGNTFFFSGLYESESTTYEAVYGQFYNLKKMLQNTRVILVKHDGLPPWETVSKNATVLKDRLRPFGVEPGWLLPLFSTEQDWNPEARVLTDQYSPFTFSKSSFN